MLRPVSCIRLPYNHLFSPKHLTFENHSLNDSSWFSTNLAPRALQEETLPDVMVESRFVKMSNSCPARCFLAVLHWDFAGNMSLLSFIPGKWTHGPSDFDFLAKLSDVVASLPFRGWWSEARHTHLKPQHSEGWGRGKGEARMDYTIRPCLRRKGGWEPTNSSPPYHVFWQSARATSACWISLNMVLCLCFPT